MVLDTGWTSAEIGLIDEFYRSMRSSVAEHPAVQSAGDESGAVKGFSTDSVSFALGHGENSGFQVPISGLPPLSNLSGYYADGAFGWSILRHFRVTIDYPRRRVLLEPYETTYTIILTQPDGKEKRISPPSGAHIRIEPDGSVIVNGERQ
jgi:hypothetical protein